MGNKYHARATILDGYRFDSQAEARRYGELKLLARAGAIEGLDVHPRFTLQEGFEDTTGKRWRPIAYEADFAYTEEGRRVIEDVKGHETQVFKLKRKLFLARYPGLELRVIPA